MRNTTKMWNAASFDQRQSKMITFLPFLFINIQGGNSILLYFKEHSSTMKYTGIH
jgi:hypothetical protein